MNSEEPTLSASERVIKTRLIVGAVAGAVVVLVLILIYGMRTPTRATTEPGVRETDKLDGARRDLAKSTDVGTCRNVVQQINLYLSDHAKRRPPALTAEQRAFLGEQCLGNASDNEMAEVAGEAFTLLDGHYLAECFLFHDAAMSLEVGGRPPAERADAAFRWTVRQIRLQEMAPPAKPDVEPDPVPPEFVVRRGWGTAMERALVFLALLRQLGVEGCLIVSPSAANGPPLCWACGALVEANEKEPLGKKDILLFDPRLGIPLPGPHGEGIATLANLREHPDELKALTVNSDFPYDVTPERVAAAAVELVEPLSALSPRMAALQKDLLGPTIKGRLALDPKESLDRWVAAAKPLGAPVRIGTRWTGVLRRFLPPDEGGSDKDFGFHLRLLPGYLGRNAASDTAHMMRRKLYEMQLAAWPYFPEQARELPWESDLGQRPRRIYGQLFATFYLEPRRPRDQVLRGRYDDAVSALNLIRDNYDADKRRLNEAIAGGLDRQFLEWKNQAYNAFGNLGRAERNEPGVDLAEAKRQVEMVWKENAMPLIVLINGQAAKPLDAECVYLIALAWQEQAVRLQARVDLDRSAGRSLNPTDVAAARTAWQTTLSWWRTLATDPSASVQNAAARTLQAEAYLTLGDGAAARTFLEDLTGDLTPLEKTARLYTANRIKK